MKIKRIFIIILIIILLGIIGVVGVNFKKLTYGIGIININEEVIIDFNKYDDINPFDLWDREINIVRVKNNNKYAYINLDNGKEYFTDFEVESFSEGYARVHNNNYTFFIDENGKRISDYFEDAEDFTNGMAAVKLKEKWGFIDKSGNLVIEYKYDEVYDFSEYDSITLAKLNNKWGIINRKGKFIIEPKYEEITIYNYSTELFQCYEDGVYKIKDFNENVIITTDNANKAYIVDEDKITINTEKAGVIDSKGNTIIDPKYQEIYYLYSENDEKKLYLAKLNNKVGVIDEKENTIINFNFDDISYLGKEIFKVSIDNKHGIVDLNAKSKTVECRDNDIILPVDIINMDLYQVKKDDKYGLIDINGNQIVECKYDSILPTNIKDTKYIIVEKDGKYGCIDRNGNEIIECKYKGLLGNNEYLVAACYIEKLIIIYSAVIFICLVLVIFFIKKIFERQSKPINEE